MRKKQILRKEIGVPCEDQAMSGYSSFAICTVS
jgi:hypothetical protein